jgi:divalent metal cation (Fe/Co/Zn/Cd) transporter
MPVTEPPPMSNQALEQGLRISVLSLVWTLIAGTVSVGLGLHNHELVLVAFGALSALDAAGSATLVVHFRHSRHHAEISAPHEVVAHTVITIGMGTLGTAVAIVSALRLASHAQSHSDIAAIALAACSLVILSALSREKRRIAPRIPSPALGADGVVSGLGAALALVTLGGVAAERAGWWAADPIASLVLAIGALVLAAMLWRERALPGDAVEA